MTFAAATALERPTFNTAIRVVVVCQVRVGFVSPFEGCSIQSRICRRNCNRWPLRHLLTRASARLILVVEAQREQAIGGHAVWGRRALGDMHYRHRQQIALRLCDPLQVGVDQLRHRLHLHT